jgi:hypothetical protein
MSGYSLPAHQPIEKPAEAMVEKPALSQALVQLIFIGLVTEIIYVTYIVAFPLISNTQAGGPAADLEILMRDYRWFAPLYTIGILLLYYLFWRTMKVVSGVKDQGSSVRDQGSSVRGQVSGVEGSSVKSQVSGVKSQVLSLEEQDPDADRRAPRTTHYALRFTFYDPKWLILAFGLLFGFTLTWLYPITANDIFRYVLRGRIWAIYGQSPMLTPPNAIPEDPYIAFAGEFGEWVSGYGPLWEILVQFPLRLGATEMVSGVIGLKLLVLGSYLLCAILIGWFAAPERGSSLAALTFFAWNPLILIHVPGNGHNDMVFMVLMVLGIILWQRKLWWAAALALSLAILAKASALLVMPLFGVVLLRAEPTWRQRLIKGVGAVLIGLVTAYLVYSVLGPVLETLRGVTDMLTLRRGFAIASEVRMILREVMPRGAETAVQPEAIWGLPALRQLVPCASADGQNSLLTRLADSAVPCNVAETMPRTTGRFLFILFYLWLLIQLWRNKLNLVTAGFLAYFSQLMLGPTFRIWYPMWLIPLAALHLTPAIFWRTFLFSLTSELSIINYFVVWRWWLRHLPWERLGLLTTLYYWPVMHTLTVPWLFGIPLFGPTVIKWWQRWRSASVETKLPEGLPALSRPGETSEV